MNTAPAWPSPRLADFWEYFPDLHEEAEDQSLTEAEISRRAFRILRRLVARIAYWFGIRDASDIDDLTQLIALKMATSAAAGWKPELGSARTYLNGVIKRSVQESIRRQAVRQIGPIADDLLREHDAAEIPEKASLNEWVRRLRLWWDSLSGRQRLALVRIDGPYFGIESFGDVGRATRNDYVIKSRLLTALREQWRGFDGP